MSIPLEKSGKIKAIGVSNHNFEEIKFAQSILEKEGLKISAVQNHFSLLNRTSEFGGILDYCKENDIIFFSYMVLEQGALSGKYNAENPFPARSDKSDSFYPILSEINRLTKAMKDIADKHNVSVTKASQVEESIKTSV